MTVVTDNNGTARALNQESLLREENILFPLDLKKSKVKVLKESEAKAMESPPEGYLMGCRISTVTPVQISRVDGRLMVLPVTDFLGTFGEFIMSVDKSINFSHIIHKMTFGRDYPGQRNPLNGQTQPAMQYHEDFAYFLSILPTRYQGFTRWLDSNQYSLTGFLGQKDQTKVERPGLYFSIKIEPLSVVIKRHRTTMRAFLISLMGILGGIWTCFAMINSFLVTIYDFCFGSKTMRRASSYKSVASTDPYDRSMSFQDINGTMTDLIKNPGIVV